ncbi:PREDICTED: uncharacterized protein LOC109221556, partial [Nicotiana attenuata]|uniref:uncharacterized protein LOC109221556 n=1 Tax=Nicotiana attenuata TaxID=49451 RepID=UPI00090590B4
MVTTLHEISQISSNSMQWNLKVRVVRMWEMPDRFNPGKPYSIELILQDAKGDRIQALIGKYVIKFFRTKIQELGLYRMNYFVVVPNNLSLKNTPHNLRLTFTQRTTVEEIVDSSFHMNIFNFRPFDQLMTQNDVDEAELFDVIGQVLKYEDVKTHKQGDNDSVFLNVQLEDDQRNRITATLWSELVDQIQPYLNGAIDEPLIVVLQFMKPQKFRGNYSECTYWIAAKLVNLELERGWSYLACNKCTKKVDKIGNKFFCEKCNEEQHSVGLRYRLQVGVIDGTAFISLLLWNREAMQIIGKSAKELKQGLVEASVIDDDCSYPSELDDILYIKFMFKDSEIPDGQSSDREKLFG